MIVLGIDAALKRCSVAILADGAVRAACVEERTEGHAERLPLLVRAAFEEAGVAAADLSRIGVVAGPGGFAGVRVGIAFARGLAIGHAIDVIGVGTLEALAAGAPERRTAAVVDARRGEVYAALYEAGGEIACAPFAAPPDLALARLLAAGGAGAALVGDAGDLVDPQRMHFARTGLEAIDPVAVARLAAARPANAGPPSPIYLRGPDAKPAAPSPFAALFRSDVAG